MTFDEEMDPYDPLIAERFGLLDRITPVDFSSGGGPSPTPMRAPEPVGGRSRYLLAAAAAIVVLAGGSALALATTGDDQDVNATDGGEVQLQADDEADESAADADQTKSLTVEVPTSGAAGIADDDTKSADDGDDETSSTTAGTGDGAAESGTGDTSAAMAETTGSTEGAVSTTVKAAKTTTTTTVPTTATSGNAQPTTSRPSGSDGSWLNPPAPEKMVTIRGMVTEVFTDCQSRLILNAAGQVESVGPVSCDGGSYIIVNGTRIHTSSGFVASDDYYGKHLPGLRPGQNVTVTAVPTSSGGGMLTLDCVQCAIKLAG